MDRKLLHLQSILIGGGTIFAWYNLAGQFGNFYRTYGTLLRVRNCVIPNPFVTPCFWGALAFLAALVWSLVLLRRYRQRSQSWLRWFLLFGTVFAFSVFGYETAQYYQLIGGPAVGCVYGLTPPLKILCLYGGLFFLASFVVSVVIARRDSGKPA